MNGDVGAWGAVVEQALDTLTATVKDHVAGVLAVLVGAGLGWALAGRGLRGGRLALWLAVPVLVLIAALCIVGPGPLFPKRPYQGPVLVRLGTDHAVTGLDLVGLACLATAMGLGTWLVRTRARHKAIMPRGAPTGGPGAPATPPATNTTPAPHRPLQGCWQRLRSWRAGGVRGHCSGTIGVLFYREYFTCSLRGTVS